MWPPPWHDDLRHRLSAAVSAVARLADGARDDSGVEAAQAEVTAELTRLRNQFSATPYPPTGAASGAVALSMLVGRVEWVADNTAMIGDQPWSNEEAPALAVTRAVAQTCDLAAAVVCDADAHPVDDPVQIEALQDSRDSSTN